MSNIGKPIGAIKVTVDGGDTLFIPISEIEKVIDELEVLKQDKRGYKGDEYDKGFDSGLDAAQERLQEVLAKYADTNREQIPQQDNGA